MRIYELAKELGVENKVVLSKAAELGMADKTSHSNSLRPDEADRIRRAIIRQAVGAPGTQETVTQRVDRVTGATDTLVERRVGNVIRRRRQAAPSEGGEAAEEQPPQEAAAVEAEKSQAVISEVAPEILETPHAVEEVQQEVADEPQREVPEASQEAGEIEVTIEAAPSAVPEAEVVDEDKKEPRTAGLGPRVLGKMELPQKKAARPETKRSSNGVGQVAHAEPTAAIEEEEEDDSDRRKPGQKRKSRKREISRLDLVDYEGREMRRAGKGAGKGGRSRSHELEKKLAQTEITKPKASKRVVRMADMITVGELAKQLSLKSGEIIAKLIELGIMANINQSIDKDTASIISEEFGYQIESTEFDEAEALKEDIVDSPENLKPRPPVVTVMGHVDHGKTSLLDSIRSASVASREHGGITQHIGAYNVRLEDGRNITFIDTPGHAAFTTMRARGAQITDIVVLVVAADDGVMPQTIEALNHAKAAGVPIVVAVNKIDKPDAKPDRVKTQLAEHGLSPEEWGGDTMYYSVSALKGTGIKELLEGILLQAEVKELRANPDRRARGRIVESKQDKGRGTVATVLVQSGTLRVGDVFVTGPCYGRVRAMVDGDGSRIEEAGPSYPVEITGLTGMPEAGDDFFVVEAESVAREVSSQRLQKKQALERSLASGPISLEEFARRANNLAAEELNIILKADVAGSVEAVKDAIEKLSTAKVKVRVLHAAVGAVIESDVQLAIASKAIIVGFGVRAEPRAVTEAEKAGVEIRFYRVIYEVLEDVQKAMVGLLEPVKSEVPLGRAEVRDTFSVSKIGTVAGCYVADGLIRRGANIRVLRDNRVVFEGKMSSLRRFKDDTREVASGFECGIAIDRFNDVKVGDVLEVYDIKESAPTLD
ncbi:MAG: translation initiation factor IF-2 [Deltaproteobacteria bacterium]|nr:translation initiation factor IF-2 [Deltaproteobacteria bacterium]